MVKASSRSQSVVVEAVKQKTNAETSVAANMDNISNCDNVASSQGNFNNNINKTLTVSDIAQNNNNNNNNNNSESNGQNFTTENSKQNHHKKKPLLRLRAVLKKPHEIRTEKLSIDIFRRLAADLVQKRLPPSVLSELIGHPGVYVCMCVCRCAGMYVCIKRLPLSVLSELIGHPGVYVCMYVCRCACIHTCV